MKIHAPNIHLLAFQLYKASNLDTTLLQDNDKNYLWQSADKIAIQTLQKQDLHLTQHIDINKEADSPRVDLLKESEVKDGDYSLPFAGKISLDDTQQVVIEGFAHPLRIHDSYGLWFNLRRPEEEDNKPTEDVDISLLSKLNLNNCFTLEKNELFLGQTLLITGWLTSARDKQNVNTIAAECLKHLFYKNDKLPPLNRQGELFGSPIFEYGLFSQLANYQHMLIWLFSDQKADKNLQQCAQELFDLFFFRTKIVKAFTDSRKIYENLRDAYKKIDKLTNQLIKLDNSKAVATNLTELENELQKLPNLFLQYSRWLHDLEYNQNTIAIHQSNYSKKLEQISSIMPSENLDFLKSFSDKNVPYFKEQIEADLGYFRHGARALEQAISSIRGIVEIVQAESDRSLEKTIQIVGVGLGGGAIVSGVVTQHIDKPFAPISFNNPFHPMVSSLFWSILATFFFGALALFCWTKQK
ncbi:hypothetical protein [Scytonema sp. PCC 10023]|uniref:hypothetical protein n=1 Tax=Scytonema sp. PCC 10023 TaxID=1680591 RepID=UPI0039C60B87